MRAVFLKSVFFAVGICVLSAISALPAEAFEVQPAIIDLSIPVGSSTEREIVVRNDEAVKKEVFFTVQKFEGDGTGSPRFLDSKDVVGLPAWLRVSTPQTILDPGASRSIKVRIDVPRDAEPGGYYAAVFTTERLADGSSMTLGRRIATLFLVDVAGERIPARIEAGGISQKYQSDQGMIDATVKNTGKTHGFATLEFKARRWTFWGSQAIEEHRVIRLLPGEVRKVSFSWQEHLRIVFFVRSHMRIQETGQIIEVAHAQPKSLGLVGGGGTVLIIGGVFLLWRRSRIKR